jgi:hypothetical protein
MNSEQGVDSAPSRTATQAADPDALRWVSYVELAAARGISRLSAERLVRKRKWQKRPGNDNTVRVLVPANELTETADGRPSNRPSDRTDDRSGAIPALREALDLLKTQLAREVARADAAEAEAKVARGGAREAQDKLTALESAEAARAGRGRWARLRAAWRGE